MASGFNTFASIFDNLVSFGEALRCAPGDIDVSDFARQYLGIQVNVTVSKKADEVKQKPKAKPKEREFGKAKKGNAKSEKPKCTAKTAKGSQCTKCMVGDGPFCAIHLKKMGGEAIPKKNLKKVVPVHTHEPGENDPSCELCNTHGDVFGEKKKVVVLPDRDEDPDEDEVVDDEAADPTYKPLMLEEDDFDD